MKKSSILLLVLVFLVAPCLVTAMSVQAAPKTIIVPDDFATISAAVEYAAEGDTIYVKKGKYEICSNETLVINKTISIIGEDAATTFLSGPGFVYGAVQVNNEGYDNAKYALLRVDTSPSNFILPPKVAFQVNADNFKISQVTIDNCDVGVSVSGNGTEVSNTKMVSASVSGSHSLISDNTITGTLSILGSYQNITRNKGDGGINFNGSFSYITKNTMQFDIYFQGSTNIITGNTFPTMFLEYADSNTISNNSFSCLWIGVYGHNCSNNNVFENTGKGPGIWGILMGAGSYNVFHDNYIADYRGDYDGYAVAIGGSGNVAENNVFYHNTFVNNNKGVGYNWELEGSGNVWDNGKEGNYWSDYNGTDANGDGIGDTPYIITDKNIDHYPLMAPLIVPPSPSPEPQPDSFPTPSPSPPETKPFPTLPISAASVIAAVIIAAALMVYFKKRGGGKTT